MAKESCLEEFKKEYEEIQKKHSLPEFEELNKDFYIEKIAENETDYLIREIRKYIADKITNYVRFVETLISPSNVSMFVFAIVKNFSEDDKKILSETYKKLAKIEVSLIELDLEFNDEKEAKFIKETYKIWNDVKKDLLKITETINKNWDNKLQVNGKSYFG